MRDKKFNRMAQGALELLLAKLRRHINLTQIARVPNLTGVKDVENSSQDHSRNCDDCTLFPATLGNRLILGTVVGILLILNGGMGDLNQHRFRYTPALVMRTDFFLPADSLLPGVSPAQQHNV